MFKACSLPFPFPLNCQGEHGGQKIIILDIIAWSENGLRNPITIASTAGLASLVNVSHMGNCYVYEALNTVIGPDLQPKSKEANALRKLLEACVVIGGWAQWL